MKQIIKNNFVQLITEYQQFISTADKKDITEETIRTWINSMLKVFCWNVQDTNEVLQERTLDSKHKERLKEINSTHSRPDYILLNGRNIKTFIDAKDLKTDIFSDKSTAFQIRSYGWSANVPCSFVTNFEQFVIFDCRFKPNNEQDVNYSTKRFHISEYVDNFDELFDHLFKNNIRTNKLEEIYAQSAVEGKEDLDSHFNKLLTSFRLKLANNLIRNNGTFKNNASLLNYYVQVILDRIIFIRVCESRGIEEIEKLKTFKAHGFWDTYKNSCYMEFYNHYDGAMFERDVFFQQLSLDDNIFDEFVDTLYYPYPYKFDVIPIKVIAQIYEDFLSKHLVIVNGKVEEQLKSEYIKEKGAISTPEYIVDAICKNTIDFENINSIVNILNIKILDPACGSGTFLISCFELLQNKLVSLYTASPIEEKFASWFIEQTNSVYLTVEARRNLIKSCLYGIDVDEAAIEVSKMSLALKVIDDNDLSVLEELGVFGDKILREIHGNIKLGNTLVSSDISLSAELVKIIKPFDIVGFGFNEVFSKNGGFDYIIGNPPYVETKHYKLASPEMHEYLREKYKAFEGKADLSVIFIERCLSLLNTKGKLGFIVQKRFFKTTYGQGIRKIISDDSLIKKIIDFRTEKLFYKRTTYVAIMILTKSENTDIQYELIPFEPIKIKAYFENVESINIDLVEKATISSSIVNDDIWAFESYKLLELISTLKKTYGAFGEYPNLHIKDGIQVLWKKAYHLTDYTIVDNYVVGLNGFGEKVKIELSVARPIIYNKLFFSFMGLIPHAYCLFPYRESDNKTPISISEMKTEFPFAYKYLVHSETVIKQAVKHIDDNEYWHIFTREHNHETYLENKIIVPMTAKDTIATCSLANGLYMDNANVWFVKIDGASDILLKAICAIINSTIFSVLAKATANPQRGGYYKLNKQFLFPVPFPKKNIVETNINILRLANLYDEISVHQVEYLKSSPNNKDVIKGIISTKWIELDAICNALYELSDVQKELVNTEGRTINRINLISGV